MTREHEPQPEGLRLFFTGRLSQLTDPKTIANLITTANLPAVIVGADPWLRLINVPKPGEPVEIQVEVTSDDLGPDVYQRILGLAAEARVKLSEAGLGEADFTELLAMPANLNPGETETPSFDLTGYLLEAELSE